MAASKTDDPTELWNDGDLRSTVIGTNGFPPEHVDAIPDEVFLGTPNGRVEMIRGRHTYSGDYWMVHGPGAPEDGKKFEAFEDAFAYALRLVREEAED